MGAPPPCGELEAAALALADAADWRAAAAAFERAAEAEVARCAEHAAVEPSTSATLDLRTAKLLEMAAQAWLEAGEARRAQDVALAATAAAPKWPEAWRTLGHAHREGACFADAAAALRRAASLFPQGSEDEADAASAAAEAEALAQLASARGLPMRDGIELRLLEPSSWAASCCPHGVAAVVSGVGTHDAPAGPANRIWEAGIVLSRWLARGAVGGAPELRGRRVLDLGSGTGIVGLAAASLGASATLSDVDDALPLLCRAADANRRTLDACGGAVDVRAFRWEDPPAALANDAPWDVLLAADAVYSRAQLGPFIGAVTRLSRVDRPGGAPAALLLAHKDRDDSVTAALLAQLRDVARLAPREVPFEAHDDAFRVRGVRLFVCAPLPQTKGGS